MHPDLTSDVTIEKFRSFDNERSLKDLKALYKEIFQKDISEHLKIIEKKSNIILLIAYKQDNPIGFKAGYAIDDQIFYSWAGGTLPEYRNLGVASTLMSIQHTECASLGIKVVETKCRPTWSNMVLLNKKFGFQIIKEYLGKEGSLKYLMRKDLSETF